MSYHLVVCFVKVFISNYKKWSKFLCVAIPAMYNVFYFRNVYCLIFNPCADNFLKYILYSYCLVYRLNAYEFPHDYTWNHHEIKTIPNFIHNDSENHKSQIITFLPSSKRFPLFQKQIPQSPSTHFTKSVYEKMLNDIVQWDSPFTSAYLSRYKKVWQKSNSGVFTLKISWVQVESLVHPGPR